MRTNIAVFFLIFYSVCSAQTKSIKKSPLITQAKPETSGMSSERLARIDSMCAKAISDGSIPGAVALVARNGKIVYHKAFGMADNQTGRALKKNDIFRIASQTKAITATAVMMLWEQGRFLLDDPISKFIPEFKDARILKSFKYEDTSFTTEAAKSEITIRQLLTHTSGIGYGIIDEDERFRMIYQKAGITDLFTAENISLGENVKKLARLPLHHNPGERFTYSEGLDVLGYLVEILSGQPFDTFLKTHLFDPLGMIDTGFYLPKEKESRLVTIQKKESGNWIPYPVTFYDPAYPVKGARRYFSGGAGLCSTAYDYAAFLQMYLNKGEINGVRILSRTTVDIVMSNQIGDIWDGNFYGLVFQVVNQKKHEKGGEASTGTFGWGGYFNSQYFADPKEKTIGIIMKQTQRADDDTPWKFLILVGQAVDD